jgi:hypothetical protein
MARTRRWPVAIPRQVSYPRRQENAIAVVGGSLCHFGCPGSANFVRSFRKVNSRSSDHDFSSDGFYHNRNEVDAETTCVVLDHHDRSCGTSYPLGLAGSVDDPVGSRLTYYPNRHGRFIPDALGSLGCRKVHGSNQERRKMTPSHHYDECHLEGREGWYAYDPRFLFVAPNNGTNPPACQATLLNMANQQLGTNFNSSNVAGSYMNGTAYNIIIQSNQLTPGQFNNIQQGRYTTSGWQYLTGAGLAGHIADETNLGFAQSAFQSSNIGGNLSVSFAFHDDHGYANNPIGALIHWITDVLGHNTRKPC